jgi:hypothetical protein
MPSTDAQAPSRDGAKSSQEAANQVIAEHDMAHLRMPPNDGLEPVRAGRFSSCPNYVAPLREARAIGAHRPAPPDHMEVPDARK